MDSNEIFKRRVKTRQGASPATKQRNMNKIEKLNIGAELFYKKLNDFLQVSSKELIETAYPQQDGIANADIIANMLQLRDTLYGIEMGCKKAIIELSEVIEIETENKE